MDKASNRLGFLAWLQEFDSHASWRRLLFFRHLLLYSKMDLQIPTMSLYEFWRNLPSWKNLEISSHTSHLQLYHDLQDKVLKIVSSYFITQTSNFLTQNNYEDFQNFMHLFTCRHTCPHRIVFRWKNWLDVRNQCSMFFQIFKWSKIMILIM